MFPYILINDFYDSYPSDLKSNVRLLTALDSEMETRDYGGSSYVKSK